MGSGRKTPEEPLGGNTLVEALGVLTKTIVGMS